MRVRSPSALKLFEIFLVIIIALLALRAEEEPVPAARADRLAFLEKGAERRDAGARADHDDGRVVILGQAKFRRGRINRRGRIGAALGEEGGANAFAFPAVAAVGHDVDDEMDRVGVHL